MPADRRHPSAEADLVFKVCPLRLASVYPAGDPKTGGPRYPAENRGLLILNNFPGSFLEFLVSLPPRRAPVGSPSDRHDGSRGRAETKPRPPIHGGTNELPNELLGVPPARPV